ncbi:hypothetical protein E4U55_003370 [Claviceps digitariae]|nr:hypothetical protein E4U55_003370 [Claviceps digitariae]
MLISTNLSLLGLCVVGTSMAAVTPQVRGLDYAESLHALTYGNLARQTVNPSSGEVWFSVKDYTTDKLPHIQKEVGIYTLDNVEALKSIAGLGQQAAEKGQWGDVVFLYNAFSMNGHLDYAQATSPEMREGLLNAVKKPDGSGVDSDLIDTYVKTSSSPSLAAAYNALRTTPAGSDLSARWYDTCGRFHKAAMRACWNLISNLQFNVTVRSGGPRSICQNGCCVSWSANATFEVRNLYNAANVCATACGLANVSCKVFGVDLQGTIVNQCLSNRPDGCG